MTAEFIPRVPCGFCGIKTTMTATKRCDRCYELEKRIEADPDLARMILTVVEANIQEEKLRQLIREEIDSVMTGARQL